MSGDLPPDPESQTGPNPRVGAPGGPPAGINTFLIADIRGYTVFTQERGDEAAAVLARAFAGIARAGVEARGGLVVELRGDEALAVFPSARQAMRAAVELQAAFAEHTAAHPDLPMRVGIGLDAGEAVQVESGYRGGALNLAARLCGTAAAGEVLASHQVVHLARRIEGLHFESRGRIVMKGLAEPVEVMRVVAGDGPGAPARRWRARNRNWQRGALVAGVAGLALLAVVIALFVTRPSGAVEGASGCELATGSLTDHAFNQAIYDGLTRAVAEHGTTIGGARSTHSPSAGLAVLRAFLKHRCGLIVSTALAQDIVDPLARRHPSQRFLLVDAPQPPALPNVLGVTFDVKQSAFLAGYVAAGVSKTGRVATFGAVPISTVTPYMDGFAAGVERYDTVRVPTSASSGGIRGRSEEPSSPRPASRRSTSLPARGVSRRASSRRAPTSSSRSPGTQASERPLLPGRTTASSSWGWTSTSSSRRPSTRTCGSRVCGSATTWRCRT